MEPVIKVKDLYKVYTIGQEKTYALRGVDLQVEKGEFVCIVGRSGSGKSTLLNMLAGLEKPSRGSIQIAGKRIERMSESSLVRFRLGHIGFVFQSFNLFPYYTAVENVAIPLTYRGVPRSVRKKRAISILTEMGLGTHLKHKPPQMSGGQQQRVGIARALVAKPDIIFADEPTGNLDSSTSVEILGIMKRLVRENGFTLIMVTHDPTVSQMADRIIHILDGKITDGEFTNEQHETPEAEPSQTATA